MPATTSFLRRHGAWLVSAGVLLALAARFLFTCDDAFISFRYARHLAEGAGLTFNPGEDPPVEGFSNLLWILVLAPFARAGLELAPVANALSLAAGCVLLALFVRLARARLPEAQLSPWAGALFLASLPPLALWATSGLETLPFALALFGVYERLTIDADRPRWVGALGWALAASLLRSDGAAWVLAVLAAAWLERPSSPVLRRALLHVGALVLLACIALCAWRLVYFHELVPNSARIKAGLSMLRVVRGLHYLASFFLAVPVVALVALLLPCAPQVLGAPMLRSALALFGLGCAYSVWAGGDFMPMGRFLVPVLPFLALGLACALAQIEARHGARRAAGFGALAIALALSAHVELGLVPQSWRQRVHFRWNEARARTELEQWAAMRERAQAWDELGRALAEHTQPGQAIVLGAVGAVGYRTELVIHDLFGLVSPEVAQREAPIVRASPGHDRGVTPDFFFARRPEFLGAWIADAREPREAAVPPAWRELEGLPPVALEHSPWSDGRELRLLRLVWPR